MATYALEILFAHFPKAHFYLVGSAASIALFAHYPRVSIIEDKSKKAKFRILNLYRLAKSIPPCDLGFTFQNNLLSALLLFLNGTKFRAGFDTEMRGFLLTFHPKKPKNIHEALRFSTLVEFVLHSPKLQNLQAQNPNQTPPLAPKLYLKPPTLEVALPQHFKDSKIIGINAGAAFGSAKRWEESYFVQVIESLLQQNYKIILFGVASENAINDKILEHLHAMSHSKDLLENVLN